MVSKQTLYQKEDEQSVKSCSSVASVVPDFRATDDSSVNKVVIKEGYSLVCDVIHYIDDQGVALSRDQNRQPFYRNKINCISLIIQYSHQLFDKEQLLNVETECLIRFSCLIGVTS